MENIPAHRQSAASIALQDMHDWARIRAGHAPAYRVGSGVTVMVRYWTGRGLGYRYWIKRHTFWPFWAKEVTPDEAWLALCEMSDDELLIEPERAWWLDRPHRTLTDQ